MVTPGINDPVAMLIVGTGRGEPCFDAAFVFDAASQQFAADSVFVSEILPRSQHDETIGQLVENGCPVHGRRSGRLGFGFSLKLRREVVGGAGVFRTERSGHAEYIGGVIGRITASRAGHVASWVLFSQKDAGN